jgi:hypothetical protein
MDPADAEGSRAITGAQSLVQVLASPAPVLARLGAVLEAGTQAFRFLRA